MFDTSLDKEEAIHQLVRSLVVTHPGPHALLYVVRVCARYTSEEFHAYVRLKRVFGESVTNNIIVALTHGDLLEEENITLDDFLAEVSGELKSMLKECGRRCIIFNNKRPGNEAHQLVKVIQSLCRGHFVHCAFSEAIRATVDEETKRRLGDAHQEELKKSCSVKALHQAELPIEAEQEARKMNDELTEVKKEVAAARTTRLIAAIAGSVVGGVAGAAVLPLTGPFAFFAGFALGSSIGHLAGEALSEKHTLKNTEPEHEKDKSKETLRIRRENQLLTSMETRLFKID